MVEIDKQQALEIISRIERLPMTRFMWFIVIICGASTFFDGFDLYTSTITSLYVIKQLSLAGYQVPLFLLGAFTGMIIGDLLIGPLTDRFGRKKLFWITVAIIGVGSLISAISINSAMMIASRIITGIGIGADLVVAYAYISELVPSKDRELVTGIVYILLIAGVPSAIALGYFVQSLNPVVGWRYVFLAGSIAALFVFILRLFLPESPRYLLKNKSDYHAAIRELNKIESIVSKEYGRALPPPVQITKDEIITRVSFKELFRKEVRRRTLLCSLDGAFGLVAGASITYFIPLILQSKGFTIQTSLLFTAIGAIGAVFGPVATSVIKGRIDKRFQQVIWILVLGIAGLFLAIVNNVYEILASAFIINMAFQGWASNYHMYLVEVFPARLRGAGKAFSDMWGRLTTTIGPLFIYTLFTSVFERLIFSFTFALIAAIVLITIGISTSYRTLEEINAPE